MKRILPGILLFLCALAASAQTTQITANQIALFGGAAVTGQFCVSPVDTSGNPINIQVPGGQQLAGTTQLCFPITNGVLSNTAVVPDTSLTQPVNSCYLLKISNNVGQTLATYPCIQPQGATWSFDSYVPSVTATIPTLSLPQFQTNGVANAVQGILNLAGSGVTYSSGGTVTIAGGGSSGPGTVTTAMLSGVDLFQAMNTLAATLPGGVLDTTQLACGTYTVTHQLTALNLTGKKFVWLKAGSCQKIIDNTVFSSSTTASPTYCGIPIGGDGAGGNAIVEVGNNTSNTGDIQAGPSFVGYDLMCNGEWDGSQNSVVISGVNLQGNASATIGGSLLHLSHVYSGTTVEKSSTYLCYANCLTVNNSGNVLFQGNQWEDGATTGSYGGAVVNIDSVSSSLGNGPLLFEGDSIQHQGPHNPLMVVNGHGGLQSGAIQFYDSYFEFSAATASTANPDVTPIQVIDSFEVGFHNARIQGLTNNGSTTDQQNAIEITSTGSFKDSFDIEINEMSVLGSMGFTCLVKNNIDNSCQPGFTNGLTGSAQILALPNYLYGQIIPTDTLTNIAAPSGWCTTYTLGSTWTNSTASTNAKLFCKLVSGTPTAVALDSVAFSAAAPGPIGGTTPSSGKFTTINGKAIAGTLYSDQYPQTTVAQRINAAMADAAALASGGTAWMVDAHNETGAQTIDTQINVGDSAGDALGLILPCSAVWTATMTGGTSSALNLYGATSTYSLCPASGPAGKMVITASSSSSLAYICRTSTSSNPYLYARGFNCVNIGGGHVTTSNVNFFLNGPLNDGTTLEEVNVYDALDTYAVEAYNVSSGTTWKNSSFSAGNYGTSFFAKTDASGYVTALSLENDTLVHPGPGNFAFLCQDTSSPSYPRISSVTLDKTYTESGTDNTTAAYKVDGCGRVAFSHTTLKNYGTYPPGNSTAPGILVTNAYNTDLVVEDFRAQYGTSAWSYPVQAVVNQYTSTTSYTDSLGNFGFYTPPSVPSSFGPITVASCAGCGIAVVARPSTLTGITASPSSVSNVYTPPLSGYYSVCVELDVATAASTSSTLPYIQITYTSAADNNAKNLTILTANLYSSNSTFGAIGNCATIYAKGGVAIGYQGGGYASSGATAMAYDLSITVAKS